MLKKTPSLFHPLTDYSVSRLTTSLTPYVPTRKLSQAVGDPGKYSKEQQIDSSEKITHWKNDNDQLLIFSNSKQVANAVKQIQDRAMRLRNQ